MDVSDAIEAVDEAIERLRSVDWKGREAVRDELIAIVQQAETEEAVRQHLQRLQGDLDLELRWEVDEVLEATAPAPEPEEEPEEEEGDDGDPDRLSASDLDLVYDDPRGLLLHKTKVGNRWFATQRDPQTGQPRTFELHPQEIQQLKTQLSGSPYWLIGSGGGPAT